jgi:hypothetical protein
VGAADTFWFKNITLAGSKIHRKEENSFGRFCGHCTPFQRSAENSSPDATIGAGDNAEVELFFKKTRIGGKPR